MLKFGDVINCIFVHLPKKLNLTIQFPNGTVTLRSRCEARLLVVYVGLSAEADVCQLTGREKVDL